MYKKIFLIILILLPVNFILYGETNYIQNVFDEASSISGRYLSINVGAEGAGMGNAYTCMAINSASIFWNPAGLNNMSSENINWNIYIAHNTWIQDMMIDSISVAKNFKNIGVFGFAISYFNGGVIPKYDIDEYGNPVENGNFSPYSLTGIISYSNALEKDIDFGVSLKYIFDNIDNSIAQALAFDIGIKYFSPIKNLLFSVVAKNFGGRLGEYILAKEVIFSSLYSISYENFKINAAYDIVGKVNNYPLFRFGVEINTPYLISVRVGYQTDNTLVEEGLKNLTFGIGLKWKDKFANFAYEPYGDIGYSFKVSLGGNFL